MGSLTKFMGIVTIASLGVNGLVDVVNYFRPTPYRVEIEKGAYVVHDRSGKTYVDSQTENLLKYLMGKDKDELRHEWSKLEKSVNN